VKVHMVQNYDNDSLEGSAVADPSKPQIHFLLVEGTGGCRSYFILNLQLK
jgi:hypothetical protein